MEEQRQAPCPSRGRLTDHVDDEAGSFYGTGIGIYGTGPAANRIRPPASSAWKSTNLLSSYGSWTTNEASGPSPANLPASHIGCGTQTQSRPAWVITLAASRTASAISGMLIRLL